MHVLIYNGLVLWYLSDITVLSIILILLLNRKYLFTAQAIICLQPKPALSLVLYPVPLETTTTTTKKPLWC